MFVSLMPCCLQPSHSHSNPWRFKVLQQPVIDSTLTQSDRILKQQGFCLLLSFVLPPHCVENHHVKCQKLLWVVSAAVTMYRVVDVIDFVVMHRVCFEAVHDKSCDKICCGLKLQEKRDDMSVTLTQVCTHILPHLQVFIQFSS